MYLDVYFPRNIFFRSLFLESAYKLMLSERPIEYVRNPEFINVKAAVG